MLLRSTLSTITFVTFYALLSACAGDDTAVSEATSDDSSASSTAATSGDSGATSAAATTSGGSGGATSASSGETSSTTQGEVIPVTVLNGSFEETSLTPDCHSNLSNQEFTAAVAHVTAFGEFNQTDVYSDCYGMTSDGKFHVGLGADSQQSDAIALELSAPLDLGAGQGYRLLFIADHGATGGATSTNVLVGVSSDPETFGAQVGESSLLSDDPSEYEIIVQEEGATYITMQVEIDGDLGWAMIDNVRLELID